MLDRDDIFINRVSFPCTAAPHGYKFVMVEAIFPPEKALDNSLASSISNFISSMFGVTATLLGQQDIFTSYIPPVSVYTDLDLVLSKLQLSLPFTVPFSYWWPINTSRASDAAQLHSESILSSLS